MKFTIELTRTAPGAVMGRIIDPQEGDDVPYEITVATMDTKLSQTRVLRDLARHQNWFVDLSEGGTK
jgi:hypothetical protein